MAERVVPDLYREHGSWGNNTTIPQTERHEIAAAPIVPGVDIGKAEQARAVFRGQEALHYHHVEYGDAPKGQWFEFGGIEIVTFRPQNPAEVPLAAQREQQRRFNGRISKSPENLRRHYEAKPSKRLGRVFEA